MDKLIIFDMDGVIFDSERVVLEGWQELADKYGFDNLKIPYMKCIGTNETKSKEIFLDFYGEDFPYEEYKKEQFINYHKKYDGGRLPLKPYVRSLLEALRDKDYKIAIASSTKVRTVKMQIEAAGLDQFFDKYVGGDMIEKSKPEPDIFLAAMEGFDVEARDVFVIEDSFNGIRAAYSAGMKPIMVPDMVEPNDEMRDKADFIKNNLEEVIEII